MKIGETAANRDSRASDGNPGVEDQIGFQELVALVQRETRELLEEKGFGFVHNVALVTAGGAADLLGGADDLLGGADDLLGGADDLRGGADDLLAVEAAISFVYNANDLL